MTTDSLSLKMRRAEALREFASARLAPPDRDEVLSIIDRALAEARRGPTDTLRAALDKAAQAEADREEKRRPYEADPLFMYLWRQRYGTRGYAAGSFVRYFDSKVAHHIGYDAARINYTLLMELPDRLHEHAERLASGPEEALDVLEAHPKMAPVLAALRRDAGDVGQRFLEADRSLAAAADKPVDGRIQRRVSLK